MGSPSTRMLMVTSWPSLTDWSISETCRGPRGVKWDRAQLWLLAAGGTLGQRSFPHQSDRGQLWIRRVDGTKSPRPCWSLVWFQEQRATQRNRELGAGLRGSDLEGRGRPGAGVRGTAILAGTELHGGGSGPGLPRFWELLWGAQILLVRGDRTAERRCRPTWRRDRGETVA